LAAIQGESTTAGALVMSPKKQKSDSRKNAAESKRAVDEFMRSLDHSFKQEIEALRQAIVGADSTISEGVKWNAPSFCTGEYFATINLREKEGIGVIFHLGAKVRDLPREGLVIDDPARLLTWLGKDRAMVRFGGLGDFNSKKAAFERIVRQWIVYV
jgi:hypothetical protein